MFQRNNLKRPWEVSWAHEQELCFERCFQTPEGGSHHPEIGALFPIPFPLGIKGIFTWATGTSPTASLRERGEGLKRLFLFPGWCCMMVSSILIPQFHKPLVSCWFQRVLAPFPLRKPFFFWLFFSYLAFFKLVADTLPWGRTEKWKVLCKKICYKGMVLPTCFKSLSPYQISNGAEAETGSAAAHSSHPAASWVQIF